jgi:lipoate-protein ligase A
VEHQKGTARLLLDESLHVLRSIERPAGSATRHPRLARILQIDQPAVILGSTQSESEVDAGAAARAGVHVARRASGGGAVLVDPEAVLWIDLIITAGDPLWDTDVGLATWWVGEAWAAAVEQIGAGPAEVWRGALQRSAWSRRVCFAGLGPGEVAVGAQKVVGISQRRTRQAALFQTAALLSWEPAALLALLAGDEAARPGAATELGRRATGVGRGRAAALTAALLAALPGPPTRD